jgi:hypothetical protein
VELSIQIDDPGDEGIVEIGVEQPAKGKAVEFI